MEMGLFVAAFPVDTFIWIRDASFFLKRIYHVIHLIYVFFLIFIYFLLNDFFFEGFCCNECIFIVLTHNLNIFSFNDPKGRSNEKYEPEYTVKS